MGVVYRAEDTTLRRPVALKFLTEESFSRQDRRVRFLREARLAAALNHPNICTVYEVGDIPVGDGVTLPSGSVLPAGTPYIAMELVEGVSLAEYLRKSGPLPLEQALEIALQVAEGLAEAHARDIVHRDLKLGNVLMDKAGRVKILDFGLAKPLNAAGKGDVVLSEAETISEELTREGMVVGTAAYMSPEQAKGEALDSRSDVFSFGIMLYEMIAGQRPFRGDTASTTRLKIIEAEPEPLPETRTDVPQDMERIIRRCLKRKPDERYNDTRDLVASLRDLRQERSSGRERRIASGVSAEQAISAGAQPLTGRRRATRSALAAGGAAVVLMAAAVALSYLPRHATEEIRTVRALLPPPEGATFVSSGFGAGPVEVSPDGRHIVFTASKEGENLLWVRSLDALKPEPLEGTNGASRPFWSPDSRSLGFFAGGKLKRIPLAGGPPLSLCEASNPRGGTWNREDLIVFAPRGSGPLFKVSAAGGEAAPVTDLDAESGEQTHRYPHFLPDGRHFLFLARAFMRSAEGRKAAVYVGSLDSRERTRLLESDFNAVYASGHLLFVREGTLMAQPFDPDRLELQDEIFPVAEDIQFDPAFSLAAFSASDNGALVYQAGGALSGPRLVWHDRTGAQTGAVGDPAHIQDVHLSPDESRAALSITDPETGTPDIWMLDLARGLRTRLTFEASWEMASAWHSDAGEVFFGSNRNGRFEIFRRSADGTGEDEFVQGLEGSDLYPTSLHPDREHLLLQRQDWSGGTRGWDIWILALSGDREPAPFIQTPFREGWSQFSPDGRWVSYMSNESGREEVYVRPYPGPGGKWQISTAGGTHPRWRGDGRELFYLAADGTLMAAHLQPEGTSLNVGRIEPLFRSSAAPALVWPYDVSADGQRFLISTTLEQEEDSWSVLVLNWTAEMGR